MRAVPLIAALCLSACATSGPTPGDTPTPPAAPAEPTSLLALGPQTLETDECGLFGWDNASRFVFFATQSRGLFAGQTAIKTLAPQGEFPAQEYGAVALRLGPGDEMIDGRRYAYARATERLEEGFTRIVPLIVIETCTAGAPAL